MEIINWFEYSESDTDVRNVVRFLKDLPSKFTMFIDPQNTTFKAHINKFENMGINSILFDEAFNETFSRYNPSFLRKERHLKLDEIYGGNIKNGEFDEDLRKCGFTGASLKLKAKTLTLLWEEVIASVGLLDLNIIDFSFEEIRRKLRNFFDYLDSNLFSLLSLIPGLDQIMELKDLMVALMGAEKV